MSGTLRQIVAVLVFVFVSSSSLSDVSQVDVKFFSSNIEIKINQRGNLTFDVEEEVKIYCHGWMDSLKSERFSNLTLEYLRKGVNNVIGADWSAHAKGFYSSSVDVIEDVGRYMAMFITDLRDAYNVSMSNVHLIGHSLGAHVCGYAGQYVHSLRGDLIGRITGLDPAGPRFENAPPNNRLSKDDAIFVDIIHTDGGALGYNNSLGHVDFFPNGGIGQVGCDVFEIACSHNRAPDYFVESINGDGFVAVLCENYPNFQGGQCDDHDRTIMGENVNRSAKGNFYLKTNSSSPFALSG